MIDKFYMGLVHAVLPLVYDDSLSYYEVLCKIRQKMNEVIDAVNAMEEEIKDVVVIDEVLDGIHKGIARVNFGDSDTATSAVKEGTLFWSKHLLRKATAAIASGDKITDENSTSVSMEEWVHSITDGLESEVEEAKALAEAAVKSTETLNDKVTQVSVTATEADILSKENKEHVTAITEKMKVFSEQLTAEINARTELIEKDTDGNTYVKGTMKYGSVTAGTDLNGYVTMKDTDGNEYKVMIGTDKTDELAGKIGTGGGGSTGHDILLIGDELWLEDGGVPAQMKGYMRADATLHNYSIANASISNATGSADTWVPNILKKAKDELTADQRSKIEYVLVCTGAHEKKAMASTFRIIRTYVESNFSNATLVYVPLCQKDLDTELITKNRQYAIEDGGKYCDLTYYLRKLKGVFTSLGDELDEKGIIYVPANVMSFLYNNGYEVREEGTITWNSSVSGLNAVSTDSTYMIEESLFRIVGSDIQLSVVDTVSIQQGWNFMLSGFYSLPVEYSKIKPYKNSCTVVVKSSTEEVESVYSTTYEFSSGYLSVYIPEALTLTSGYVEIVTSDMTVWLSQ